MEGDTLKSGTSNLAQRKLADILSLKESESGQAILPDKLGPA